MTEYEGQIILFESLIHTENSRVDYFFKKAIEYNIEPVNLFLSLHKIYESLKEYVNSSDCKAYEGTIDDPANIKWIKRNINLYPFTNGRLSGRFNHENIIDLLPALHEFGQKIRNDLQQKETQKGKVKNTLTGFQNSLTDEQINKLYNQLQGNLIDTTLDNFKEIFHQNITNFTPIKRTKKFNNSLLIYFASCLFQKDNPNDYVSITEYCFNAKNLSQTQNNYIQYNSNHKPRGFQKMDKIIQTIYTPLQ